MAKQAEAERERRAKIIHADGEFQASEKLAEAAGVIGRHPMTLQLRFLQSLVEVASEKNSTTIFPVPIDLLTPFLKKGSNTVAVLAVGGIAISGVMKHESGLAVHLEVFDRKGNRRQ